MGCFVVHVQPAGKNYLGNLIPAVALDGMDSSPYEPFRLVAFAGNLIYLSCLFHYAPITELPCVAKSFPRSKP